MQQAKDRPTATDGRMSAIVSHLWGSNAFTMFAQAFTTPAQEHTPPYRRRLTAANRSIQKPDPADLGLDHLTATIPGRRRQSHHGSRAVFAPLHHREGHRRRAQ